MSCRLGGKLSLPLVVPPRHSSCASCLRGEKEVGILICADRRWPENARVLAVRGAEAILIPSYGIWNEANDRWMLTRAYENGRYVCFAHRHVCFVANPKGEMEARLQGNVDGVLLHDLDLGAVLHNHIEQRRWDLTGPLARP